MKRERPALERQHRAVAGTFDHDLRAFRQLAHDLIEHVRRHRGGTAGRHFGRDGLGDLEIEVGGLEGQLESSAGETRTLARIGMVLRRSTTRCTCPSDFSSDARSTVTFICGPRGWHGPLRRDDKIGAWAPISQEFIGLIHATSAGGRNHTMRIRGVKQGPAANVA